MSIVLVLRRLSVHYKILFLGIEQNWPRVVLNSNFSAFRMEKGEVSQDNKVPKAASKLLLMFCANPGPDCSGKRKIASRKVSSLTPLTVKM